MKELLQAKRAEILRIAAAHGASNMRIFGSVARGEDDGCSDVDFLVKLEAGRSLMDHAALLVELEALLGCEWMLLRTTACVPRSRIESSKKHCRYEGQKAPII